MDDHCIPANPDISGIGVRAAIYAQNLLCFAPVMAHLWDGTISKHEMKGVKDQSIGMLAIAFAILISTIVQAKTAIKGQEITKFHATVILDLSWMNNTCTWIWFILYAHHRSKTNTNSVDPTFWAWYKVLCKPLDELTEKPLIQGLLDLVSEAPVLTLGSAHLSLMAAVRIWLWCDPSKFGSHIICDPSFAIVGHAVPFSSPALRIFSLTIYSLFVIPGFNLVLPFFFFLTLHISYDMSRKRHPGFYQVLGCIWRQHTSLSDKEFQREEQHPASLAPSNPSPSSPHANPVVQEGDAPMPHTTFLVVGLACLFIVNILFLTDIELSLVCNKHLQSGGEELWGFGQVLALLLLIVPL